MTTTTPPVDLTAPQATTPPQPGDATSGPADEPADTDATGRRRDPAGEAAARRHQLREAEATIGTQAAQITVMQRAAVENLIAMTTGLRGGDVAGVSLQRAADIWEVLGANPADFFADDGTLDAVALADFIDAGTAERPYLTRHTGPVVGPKNTALDAASSMTRGGAQHRGARADWSAALSTAD